ncbi:MAG: hypothetical protein ACK5KP_04505 [Paludibacteraceae bacterium]
MKNEIVDLALKYLAETSDSNYKIAKATGISESGIGRYVNKKSVPTLANAKLLVQYFEGILLTDVSSEAKYVEDLKFMNVPTVHIHAQAGYTRGYGDQEYIENLPTIPVIVDKNYRGKYRVFEIEGDSMDDGSRNSICEGDKVLGREVMQSHWTSKLHYKNWYFIIVMKDDGILAKQIINHDVENHKITCHSLNYQMFPDFEVDLRDVAELYNIIKIVDRNTRI